MTVRDDSAVSPVIGVILMVAIVVILAAVIAAFVFGMAGSTGSSKNIGMTVRPVPDTTVAGNIIGIEITWQGGADLKALDAITVTNGANEVLDTIASDTWPDGAGTTASPPTVGMVSKCTFTTQTPGTRIIVRGTFTDGAEQVIFDKIM